MADNIFDLMSLDELQRGAQQYPTRAAYLASLGFKGRNNYRLARRLAAENLTHANLWPNPFANSHRRPQEHHVLDLSVDLYSYFFGLAVADGHLRQELRNRGCLSIDLKSRDEDILLKLIDVIPWRGSLSRCTKETNFGWLTLTTARWYALDLRAQLIERGFIAGEKSATCRPPTGNYDRNAFWRGYIDGNGSVGLDAKGIPFISAVIVSETLANEYKAFLLEAVGYAPGTSRNARDGVYNIMLARERAVVLAQKLYRPGCLALARKADAARQVLDGR